MLAELEKEASSPTFWNDQNKAKQTIEKTNRIRIVLKPFGELVTLLQDSELLVQLAEELTLSSAPTFATGLMAVWASSLRINGAYRSAKAVTHSSTSRERKPSRRHTG